MTHGEPIKRRMKNKNLESIVSIRFSPDEFQKIAQLAEKSEEKFVTRFMRKVILDCVDSELARKGELESTLVLAAESHTVSLQRDKVSGKWYLCPNTTGSKEATIQYVAQGKDRFIASKEKREITELKEKLNKAIAVLTGG